MRANPKQSEQDDWAFAFRAYAEDMLNGTPSA
jgi:hypothetical protein